MVRRLEIEKEYDKCQRLASSIALLLSDNKFNGKRDIVETNNKLFDISYETKKYLQTNDIDTLKDVSSKLERINDLLFKVVHNDDYTLGFDAERYHLARMMVNKCHRNLTASTKKDAIAINSEDFYKTSIDDAQKRIDALNKEISSLKKDRSSLEKNEKQLKEKEDAITSLNASIKEYEKREQERRLRDDAIANWEIKITRSFGVLEGHIEPIKKEHKRLCELYWIYNGLSAGIIVLLIIIEIIVCRKICHHNGIPTIMEYIALILPVPVAIGLLWGFITQANRAQRQRVVLSKFIHDIKYTEGILLAINNLATDAADSAQRINNALDKLLEKHLSNELWKDKECYLKNEESKDAIPYEALMSAIKSLRVTD